VKRALVVVSFTVATACAPKGPLAPKAIALNDLGARSYAADDLEHAEAELALALEYNPRFTEAWVNLGLVELRIGNVGKARHHFRRAIELNPDLPAPFHGMGLLEEKIGDLERAEKNYREALKVDPGFGPARVNLGRMLFARRDFDRAREQFLRLTEVAPDVVEGWSGLVESLLKLRRDHDADDALDRARARLGERPELVLLVARRLLRHGEADAALAALDPLTRESKAETRANALAWIAVARAIQGDVISARDAASLALALDPHNEVARYAASARTNVQ